MRLNLSDQPATIELLSESLRRTGGAVISINGNSMYPTLQMGWRVHLGPATGTDLKIGEIGVFRGAEHLTTHRLIWRERKSSGGRLVFRGDHNRQRERVAPDRIIARVVAIEVPGRRPGTGQTVVVRPDLLTWFYRSCYGAFSLVEPLLPRHRPQADAAPGPVGRAARALFTLAERLLSMLLRDRRR